MFTDVENTAHNFDLEQLGVAVATLACEALSEGTATAGCIMLWNTGMATALAHFWAQTLYIQIK